MVKTKNKNIYPPLVITGYIAFAMLVASTLISTTIPFGRLLFVDGARVGNILAVLIALTVGSILPALIGYLVGDHAVKSKSRLSHHFNGVLFGLLGFWIMIVMGAYLGYVIEHSWPLGGILSSLIPSALVALLTIALAIAHVRGRYASRDLIEYKPFIFALIAAVIAMPIGSVIQGAMMSGLSWHSFVPVALLAVAGAVTYATLHNTKLVSLHKVAWSAVAVSVLYALYITGFYLTSVFLSYVLNPTSEGYFAMESIALALAVIGWIVYWTYQVKSLTSKKRK